MLAGLGIIPGVKILDLFRYPSPGRYAATAEFPLPVRISMRTFQSGKLAKASLRERGGVRGATHVAVRIYGGWYNLENRISRRSRWP